MIKVCIRIILLQLLRFSKSRESLLFYIENNDVAEPASPALQSLLDSRAQMAARSQGASMGQSEHTADLLRMTRESMNGSFTSKLSPARPTIGMQATTKSQSSQICPVLQ
jgi:hypothetical protein